MFQKSFNMLKINIGILEISKMYVNIRDLIINELQRTCDQSDWEDGWIQAFTGASQYIRMSQKSSFISVIQLKLWNSCIK